MKYFFVILCSFLLSFKISFSKEITFIEFKSKSYYSIDDRDAEEVKTVIYEDNVLQYTDKISYEDAQKILDHYIFDISDDVNNREIEELKIIPKLLDLHPSLIDNLSKNGEDYLFFAYTSELVDLFIEKGLVVESLNNQEQTPLQFALQNQYPEDVVLALIKQGSDIDKKDSSNIFPLTFAVENGYSLEVIEKLIPSEGLVQKDRLGKVKHDLLKDFLKISLVLDEQGQIDMTYRRVKWLLETYPEYLHYEDLNDTKDTLLHEVSDRKTAEYLINRYKLSPYVKNAEGLSPIHTLVLSYNNNLHKIYESQLDDLWKYDDELRESTDAMEKQIQDAYLETIKFLIEKDERLLNLKDADGTTALQNTNDFKLLSVLLELGFDMSVQDHYKQNALHYAVETSLKENLLDILNLFLEHNPSEFQKAFNAKNESGETAKKLFESKAPLIYKKFQRERLANRSGLYQSPAFQLSSKITGIRKAVSRYIAKIK